MLCQLSYSPTLAAPAGVPPILFRAPARSAICLARRSVAFASYGADYPARCDRARHPHCDGTESMFETPRRALAHRPGPPALLPVGHSPGRRRCRQRRWSLTPPLSSLTLAGGVCLLLQLSSRRRPKPRRARACCFARQPCMWESGSSSREASPRAAEP